MTEPGNDLELDLRRALRRKGPSAGFAARVLANLPEERPRRWWTFHQPVLRWATAAVLFAAVASGGYAYRERQLEEARGREAKKQLMLALRITGAKLQLAQHRVQQIGADRAAASQQQMERE